MNLKKLTLPLFIALASNGIAQDVTPYLLINKEYRVLNQESSANKNTSTGVTDVDGFETRLGIKGKKDTEDGIAVSGKIELGINSARDDGNGERIRIRLAQIDFITEGSGSLTLGQHWNPNTLRMLKLDPLTATGAQLLGLESGDVEGAVSGNFGMRARYFNDGITYTSPSFSGFKASITADQNSDTLDQNTDGQGQEWHTFVVSYDTKIGAHGINSHFTYAMGDVENVAGTDLDNNQSFMTLGVKYSAQNYGASFAYTSDSRGETLVGANKEDIERQHTLLTGWYTQNKTTFAFNYGSTAFGDKENVGTSTDAKGGSQTQMAAGVLYALTPKVKTRLVYRIQNIETDGNGVVAGTSSSNDTNAIILGATASF